ncbi:MAG TPA: arginine deiminase-related protein, partial [Steroidobacteraceae bacterium]|nr:arginine deiminase-related protein [Steroidobacteraceae bacterium]
MQGGKKLRPESVVQCAEAVLMVRPRHFGFNAETAATNRFQQSGASEHTAAQARAEFDAFANALAAEGVKVCVAEDADSPRNPDAVFPNNWVSFHADGTVVLYPMQAASRRGERRAEVIDAVVRETGFRVTRTLDLTHHELQGRFLEGTGSLVLDHLERVAYACRSPRTHESVAREWAHELGYELQMFTATDARGTPIYHTNVVMSINTRVAVVASECIDPADRGRIINRVGAAREVLPITEAEMQAFAGNVLELGTWDE